MLGFGFVAVLFGVVLGVATWLRARGQRRAYDAPATRIRDVKSGERVAVEGLVRTDSARIVQSPLSGRSAAWIRQRAFTVGYKIGDLTHGSQELGESIVVDDGSGVANVIMRGALVRARAEAVTPPGSKLLHEEITIVPGDRVRVVGSASVDADGLVRFGTKDAPAAVVVRDAPVVEEELVRNGRYAAIALVLGLALTAFGWLSR